MQQGVAIHKNKPQKATQVCPYYRQGSKFTHLYGKSSKTDKQHVRPITTVEGLVTLL